MRTGTIVLVLYFVWPAITSSILQLWKCHDYGEGVGLVFLIDPETKCTDSTHLLWRNLLGWPCVVVYIIGLPTAAIYALYRYRKKLIAAYYEHFQIVKYLIEQGEADPNIADSSNGQNALHFAAYYNKKDTKVIELLLTNMSLTSINKKAGGTDTPLDKAYKYNKSPIQQKIFDLIRSKGGKRKSEL